MRVQQWYVSLPVALIGGLAYGSEPSLGSCVANMTSREFLKGRMLFVDTSRVFEDIPMSPGHMLLQRILASV